MTCLFCNHQMKSGSGFTMHLRHKHPDRVGDVNNYLVANPGKGFEDAMEFLTKPDAATGAIFNLKSYDISSGTNGPGYNVFHGVPTVIAVDDLITLAYNNLKDEIKRDEAKLAELEQLREKLTRDYDKLRQLEQIVKPAEHAKPGDHTPVTEPVPAEVA